MTSHSTATAKSPAKKESKPAEKPRAPQSASKRADTEAKKGEPLGAESPRERSPKQENL